MSVFFSEYSNFFLLIVCEVGLNTGASLTGLDVTSN